jgi:hypothetical protein
MRQLDFDLTPADRYLNTPEGRVYREMVSGFHWAELSFSKGRSRDKDNDHEFVNVYVERLADANAVGSFDRVLGMHCPVLDLDVPAMLVPSSTPGNNHLYIRKPMPWHQYSMLLQTLSYVGILEEGYTGASVERHHESFARTPWTRK